MATEQKSAEQKSVEQKSSIPIVGSCAASATVGNTGRFSVVTADSRDETRVTMVFPLPDMYGIRETITVDLLPATRQNCGKNVGSYSGSGRGPNFEPLESDAIHYNITIWLKDKSLAVPKLVDALRNKFDDALRQTSLLDPIGDCIDCIALVLRPDFLWRSVEEGNFDGEELPDECEFELLSSLFSKLPVKGNIADVRAKNSMAALVLPLLKPPRKPKMSRKLGHRYKPKKLHTITESKNQSTKDQTDQMTSDTKVNGGKVNGGKVNDAKVTIPDDTVDGEFLVSYWNTNILAKRGHLAVDGKVEQLVGQLSTKKYWRDLMYQFENEAKDLDYGVASQVRSQLENLEAVNLYKRLQNQYPQSVTAEMSSHKLWCLGYTMSESIVVASAPTPKDAGRVFLDRLGQPPANGEESDLHHWMHMGQYLQNENNIKRIKPLHTGSPPAIVFDSIRS